MMKSNLPVKTLCAGLLLLAAGLHASAQEAEDSLRLHYRQWLDTFETPAIAPADLPPLFSDREKSLKALRQPRLCSPDRAFSVKRLSLHAILPAAMIGYGVLSRRNEELKELDTSTANEVGEHLKVKIPLDDYSQYAPLAAVFLLDPCGIKARHNLRDRALIAATSYAIMGAAVNTMKSALPSLRPDRSDRRSFPSGHTATAFTGAHILFKEYHDVSPWIGIAGYGVATATGTLRVLNKKHWVSDVVTGAGVGILSAELGYRLLPVMHRLFGIREPSTHIVVLPACSARQAGVGVVCTF